MVPPPPAPPPAPPPLLLLASLAARRVVGQGVPCSLGAQLTLLDAAGRQEGWARRNFTRSGAGVLERS